MPNLGTAISNFFSALAKKTKKQNESYGLPNNAFNAQTGSNYTNGLDFIFPSEALPPKVRPEDLDKASEEIRKLQEQAINTRRPDPAGNPLEGRRDSPRIEQLYGQMDEIMKSLGTRPPAPEVAKVDPLRAALSTFAGLGIKGNPGLQSALYSQPVNFAEAEAAKRNATNAEGFGLQQKTAQAQLDAITTALGHELSRDAVTERIKGQLDLQSAKAEAAQTLQQIKNQPAFWKTLAQYGAGMGPESVSSVLQTMGMTDPQQVQAVTDAIMTDPNSPLLLKRAQVEQDAEKNAATRKMQLRKAIGDTNARPEDRLSAMMELADLGDPLFASMSYDQLVASSERMGQGTRKLKAQADDIVATRAQRITNLVKTGNFLDARTEASRASTALTNIRTQYMPGLMAAQTAKINADADKAERDANDALFGYQNGIKPVTGTAYFNALNDSQKALDETDAALIYNQAEIARIQNRINAIESGRESVYDAKGNEIEPEAALQELHTAMGDAVVLGTFYNALKSRQQSRYDGLKNNPPKAPEPQANGAVSERYKDLVIFAQNMGFHVTDGLATSGHNPGSKHYRGEAVDVRTRDKSNAEINAFIAAARANGIKVIDERKRPPGQAVWSGPHLHIEFAAPAEPRRGWWQPKGGGSNSTAKKTTPTPKAKGSVVKLKDGTTFSFGEVKK